MRTDRVSWGEAFIRLAVGLWIFEVACQLIWWLSE